jgi:hypothetical protein
MVARVALLAWLVAAGLWAATQPTLGDDLWWVLATGRHIVETGAIPHQEIFSFSAPGHLWFHQEWLTHSLFYVLYRSLGGDGLAAFKVALATGTIVLLGLVAARRSGSLFCGVLAAAFAAWACEDDLDLRAKIFTVLNSIVMLAILYRYRRGGSPRTLALLPPLMLLWANLHYGFVYGLVILGACFGTETVKSLAGLPESPMPLRRSLLLGGALAAAVVATLLNPQPMGAFEIALEHLRPDNPWRNVIEWKPPPLFRHGWPTPFGVSLAVQGGAAALALAIARKRFDLTDFALVAATGAIALDSRRFAPLFAFVGAPFLARNLALVAERAVRRSSPLRKRGRAAAQIATAVGLVGFVGTVAALVPHVRATFGNGLFAGMTYLPSFPTDAVRFLRHQPLAGERLYDFYSWGGFLLFELPGVPIYVDGRAAVAYPPSIADEYRLIERGGPASFATLRRYGANVVLHHVGFDLPLRLRQRKDWVRIYDDGLATIFVRRAPTTATWLEAFERGEIEYPDSAGAQLFAAEQAAERGDRAGAVQRILDVIRRFPADGLRSAVRRQRVELQAGLTTDPQAMRIADLYRAAFERLGRGR